MSFRSPYPDVVVPEQAFGEFVFAQTGRWPERAAFVDGASGRTLTHGQVLGAARRVAAALARRGMRKGDVLALFSPNLPEYAVAFHGAALAGGVVTTANPLLTEDELAAQLGDSGARFLVTAPPFLEKARAAATRCAVEEVFVVGDAPGATPFAALLQADGAPPEVAISPREDLLALPYSSGTTGCPKGVMLTHRNAVAALAQAERLALYGAGDTLLAVLPFFHCYGMQLLMNEVLRVGATCVTMPRFELEPFLALVQRHRVSHLFVVPPIVLALAKHPLVERYDLSSIRSVGCGAAPLDAGLERAATARVGVAVKQGYGMTEATVLLSANTAEASRPGSAGRLVPSVEARVVDPDSGAERPAGEAGELLVRGPNVMRGYLRRPDETLATVDADGWLHTGDVARVDEDGFLYIVDRLKELIKCNAYQVAPAQLEGVLQLHPAVADAAVIGVPDEQLGEAPKAFVALKGPATADEIAAFAAARLAPYERLRAVEIVDAIPRAPSGKLLRRLLRDRERARARGAAAPDEGAAAQNA